MEKVRRDHHDIAPTGPSYSRTVRVGNLLFIAGCTARGTDAQGKGLIDQLRVTLDRIIRIVAAEGGSPGDILKITTFVTNVPDWVSHTAEQESLFAEVFKGEYPANSLIGIGALVEPGLDVEIEAIAEIS